MANMAGFYKYCIISVLLLVSCSTQQNNVSSSNSLDAKIDSVLKFLKKDQDNISLYSSLWWYYKMNNQTDSLYWHASRTYKRSIADKNYDLAAYSASYLIHIFMETGLKDSALYYLDTIENFKITNEYALGAISRCFANYYMTYVMDYPKAMKYNIEASNFFASCGDTINYVLAQHNMASIYFLRKDTASCLRYSRNGQEMAMKTKDNYIKCLSSYAIAKVYYSLNKCDSSLHYLEIARKSVTDIEYLKGNLTDIYTISAYNYAYMKKFDSAYIALKNAEKYLDYAQHRDVFTKSRFEIACGDYYFDTGEYEKSKILYIQAIRNEHLTIDAKKILLLKLSAVYKAMGVFDSSLSYYHEYNKLDDSIFSLKNENEFNRIFIDRETNEIKEELSRSILESKRTTTIILLIALTIIAATTTLWYVSRKNNKKYAKLITEYQEKLDKKSIAIGANENITDKTDTKTKNEIELWNRLKDAMETDGMYKDNGISLEKLAEALGTNRAYVSNVINKYAKMTFNSYVNMLRIKDATKILADPDKEPVLKSLYFDLGYNSKSAFYNAFQKETGCTPMIYRKNALKMKLHD